ncbi:MAG: sulfatase-like hydrolase/transferase [Clostridiales bacterium]|nr:sulfatase-like hydrolase/transferase [Clostridiales bacterium]
MLLYFIASLFYLESLLRISLGETFLSTGFLISLLLSIPFSILSYIICTGFNSYVNYIMTLILTALWGFIFASQILYYKLFKTFYTFFSVGNAGQILEFWRDILALIAGNILWILFAFVPCISVVFLKEFINFISIGNKIKILLIGVAVLIHIAGVSIISLGEKAQFSAYDLYFNNDHPVMSVKKLGLITYMRLDIQRLIFGWSPQIAEPIEILPKPFIEITDKPEPVEKTIKYNTLDIDFVGLISNEENETIKNMHHYFMNVEPTAKNDYTGKYKGYNLILITAESFSPYAVHKDVTPTLYKLVHEGYYFTNFYTPIWGVSTSDGEYVACTSLIPKRGVWSFYLSGKKSMPYVLGNQLKTQGYNTMAYHNNTYTYYKRNISHPNMGYEYKGVGNGLNIKKSWPASDLEMMEKTIPEYIDKKPFHAYYMTVSGHMRYNFTGNAMAAKNRKLVEHLPYSEAGKAYIACQIELDRALEYLLNKLEEAGIADKTLIALSSDHYPYGLELEEIDDLAGYMVERNFELYKNHFILYTKGIEPTVIDKPCSSLDILPTISNLMGLDYDSRLFMGRDIFSDSEPLVIFENKSFITDKGFYNSINGIFTPNSGEKIDEDYINTIKDIVDSKFYYSAKILETDYYKYVSK